MGPLLSPHLLAFSSRSVDYCARSSLDGEARFDKEKHQFHKSHLKFYDNYILQRENAGINENQIAIVDLKPFRSYNVALLRLYESVLPPFFSPNFIKIATMMRNGRMHFYGHLCFHKSREQTSRLISHIIASGIYALFHRRANHGIEKLLLYWPNRETIHPNNLLFGQISIGISVLYSLRSGLIRSWFYGFSYISAIYIGESKS